MWRSPNLTSMENHIFKDERGVKTEQHLGSPDWKCMTNNAKQNPDGYFGVSMAMMTIKL